MKHKKILLLTLAVVLLLLLTTCRCVTSAGNAKGPGTEATENSTVATQTTDAVESTTATPLQSESSAPTSDITVPIETEPVEKTEVSKDSEPPQTNENTHSQTAQPTEPKVTTQVTTKPVETTPATQPADTPTEPVPAPTEPTPTEPEPTEAPETQPTEPAPTEPAGCQHDWICVHHDAEGHWLAGVRCDCGLEFYGDPEELPELWNAHSASFPPAESLFEHGGYASADQWIEDKPAYDEWVCRHCGEEKP